jgi:hypothetical protein
MHKRKIWDRYLVGMLGGLCLFTLALATFIKMDRHMPQGLVRTMILVSPLAALVPFMWAVVRQVRRDEVLHTRKIWFRYIAEMSAAFLLYALVLVVSIDVGFPMHKGIGRTLLLVSPTLPFLLVVWAVARQFRRMDEYVRLIALESIAMAFGVTAGWVVTYGFMENAGYPRLSMFTVWMVMMSAWAVIAIVRTIAGR